MRSVDTDEISKLLEWKPLMLLNMTVSGPAFIESVVARSPALITSKSKGGKVLPLELWDIILEFAISDPKDHKYTLVRPGSLQQASVGGEGEELICSKYKRWSAFGMIQDYEELSAYAVYLAHPDSTQRRPNPFGDPNTRQFGPPASLPTTMCSSKIKCLHVSLTVPDVIRYLEDGRCQFYRGEHITGHYYDHLTS
ncbi:hypothetical protein IL306_013768 [Fusarium sp. DS 682]|nr:hypothetical protein IL306_013768 [Fusarium sp. DS 682]